MALLDVMHAYFRGERAEALGFILPTGLALLGFAVVATKVERPAFGWGVAIPCIAFGTLAVAIGLTVGLRTPTQVTRLEAAFAATPSAMVAQELTRIREVGRLFDLYAKGHLLCVLLGVALRFLSRADWARGSGPALILVAAFGLMIDGFAHRRCAPYVAALETFSAADATRATQRSP
jgi:hypothetical protein